MQPSGRHRAGRCDVNASQRIGLCSVTFALGRRSVHVLSPAV